MEKLQWRKEPWYKANKKPQILEMPTQKFFSIKGDGDPNQPEFQQKIECLYTVSYAIRMAQKAGWEIPDYQLYTVYPLEGWWSLQERYLQEAVMKKEHFTYEIMIQQPAFVTQEIAEEAIRRASKKLPAELISQLMFSEKSEGLCAQILHIGPYDDEPQTFHQLKSFLQEEGYERTALSHKEIYLSDVRKTAPEKLKTLLRVPVKKADVQAAVPE